MTRKIAELTNPIEHDRWIKTDETGSRLSHAAFATLHARATGGSVIFGMRDHQNETKEYS